MRTPAPWRLLWSTLLIACAAATSAWAEGPVTLNDIRHAMLSADRARIELELSGPVSAPPSYAILNPARIVLDLPGVSLRLPPETLPVNAGLVRRVTAVEAAGRTRVVVNLVRPVPYEIRTAGQSIYITIGPAGTLSGAGSRRPAGEDRVNVSDVSFLKGQAEEGRVIITLAGGSAGAVVRPHGSRLTVELPGVHLPEHLARRLDVLDFATPMRTIESFRRDDSTRVVVTTTGPFDYLAYQQGDVLIIAVRPSRVEEQALEHMPAFRYEGWPLAR